MNERKTLDHGDKHLLRLVVKGANSEGWAKVSEMVRPLMEALPTELVTLRTSNAGCEAKLTEAGETVLLWT